jgi:hypothetical protein
MPQISGSRLNAVRYRGIFLFPITVMGKFIPAASIAATTVTHSFSLLSTAQETDSLLVTAQGRPPPATDRQFVSSIFTMRLRETRGNIC